MIARQATEWANEKGLEKGGLENSVAPGAMDALTTADRTLHSNRGPPYGKREREPALGRYKEMLLVRYESSPKLPRRAGEDCSKRYRPQN
jgi:hypothetical protein